MDRDSDLSLRMMARYLWALSVIQHHKKLASNVTNGLVMWSSIMEQVKRLAGNDIELGMAILTIKSRASNILLDKGNCIRDWLNPWHHGSTDKDLRGICGNQYGHPGPAIGYWSKRCLDHVHMILEPLGSARLTFGEDIVLLGYVCWWPNVVQSPRWDPECHEELRNGPEVKIYIWEVLFLLPEKFRVFPMLY